jgi:hypothetical protein
VKYEKPPIEYSKQNKKSCHRKIDVRVVLKNLTRITLYGCIEVRKVAILLQNFKLNHKTTGLNKKPESNYSSKYSFAKPIEKLQSNDDLKSTRQKEAE